MTCIICGCTDDRACPGGCSWSWRGLVGGKRTGICTRCAFTLARAKKFRKALQIGDTHRQTFDLGVMAGLTITRSWPQAADGQGPQGPKGPQGRKGQGREAL